MKQIIYLLIITLLFLGGVFSFLNPGSITINYYLDSLVVSKAIFVIATVCLGFLFGLVIALAIYIRLKRVNYSLKKQIYLANKELDNLRTIPIKDHH